MTENPPTLYCVNHPTVETSLRCNNCEDPICPKCAVLTPTGYRCKKCVRNQQKTFDTAEWYDYPISFIIAAAFAYLGSQVVPFVSFFVIFLAPVAGMFIAEVVRLAVRKRRSKLLFTTAAIGAAIGSLPSLLGSVMGFVLGAGVNVFGLIWYGFYAFTITSTVYYRLRGIKIR